MITKKQRVIIVVIVIITTMASSTGLSVGCPKTKDISAYLIVINTLTLDDIEYMSNLRELVEEGSIGLMNTRGAKGYDGPQSYISINTSSRSYADDETSIFFNVDSNDKKIYARRVGQDVLNSQIVNLGIVKLLKLNKDLEFSPSIGLLGENLHKSGYRTAVFGNSDTADSFARANCLIAMDGRGFIDYGNIGDILIQESDFPGGLSTDYNKLIAELQELTDKIGLIVIETGDLNRLNSCKHYLTEEMYLFHRKKALERIDNFIGELIKNVKKEQSLLMIISPNGQESINIKSKLSPIILWGNDISKGIVISNTTRRNGIVSNIDIAPTVTHFLEGSKEGFLGYPIRIKEMENNLQYTKDLNNRTNFVSNIRSKSLKIFSFITMITIALITLLVVLYSKYSRPHKKLWIKIHYRMKFMILLIISVPIALLLVSTFQVVEYLQFCTYVVIILFVIFFSLVVIKGKYRLLFITGITIFTIQFDIITGGNLIKLSVLGYDPIIGARYYGIGNEMVGVLLGTGAIFCGYYLEIFKKHYYIFIVLGILIITTAHPALGANVGGSIAFIFMSIFFVFKVFRIHVNLKRILLILTSIVISIFFLAIIDLLVSDNPSHLGRLLQIMIQDDPMYIINIVIRKLKMNIRLIGVTIWTKVLIITLSSIVIILFGLMDRIRNLFKEKRLLAIGIISALVGNLMGLIVNDSGIIMSSLSNIYVASSLMYVTISEVD